MVRYTASKVRGVGRESWSVIFRHPVRKDQSGKIGLRVKKGLGTTDEAEAQILVDQLNEILADSAMWTLGARESAASRYHQKVVAAFYEAMDPKPTEYQKLRDVELPLPGADRDYARVLLVGTTGAGKTTLLRQFIGSDPKTDRFPSTSPNKTTVSDIEVICAAGSYKAVVTFFDIREVRLHVEDCVMDSIFAKVNGMEDAVVAQRLLEHSEQRFRFFYVLGEARLDSDDVDDEDDEEEPNLSEPVLEQLVSPEEKSLFAGVIQAFLERVTELSVLSGKVREQISSDLAVNPLSLPPDDRQAFEELLEEEIRQCKEFYALVDDMVDAMAERFKWLDAGKLEYDGDEWPTVWKFQTDDREQFIKTVRRFSSNYAPHFGKLLTPLVQGIRVQGPFKPAWSKAVPRLVFIDGQGIGHTVSSITSLPAQTSRRFETCDVVLLVDSAEHPMQAASLAVLRSLAASGHMSKARICFTHLDGLKGDNLPTRKSRVTHVAASLHQAVTHIRDVLGAEVAANLDVELGKNSYFLASLDQSMQEKDKSTLAQLQDLLSNLEASIFQDISAEVMPVYGEANLVFAVQHAARQFHEAWKARLGLVSRANEPAQHWTRIKALSRRLAQVFDDGEYAGLRPVAELRDSLMLQIRIYLNQPIRWVPGSATDEEKKNAVERIAREINSRLLDMATRRVWTDKLHTWALAYEVNGRGSGLERARWFQRVYEQAAPIPGDFTPGSSQELLSVVKQIVKESVDTKGGRMLSS